MMSKASRVVRSLVVLGVLLAASLAYSEMDEPTQVPLPAGDTPIVEDMYNDDMHNDDMHSDNHSDMVELDETRLALQEIAARDDMRDLNRAEAELADAERALAGAIDDGADQSLVDALTEARNEAQADVEAENGESDAVAMALVEMSDDQVIRTTRALRNATKSRLAIDLDAATLQEIADRDLGNREIQALTKALEEEARAMAHADRFEAKYEATGREKFLEQRDRALDRGDRQRAKFENKVDRFTESREMVREETRAASRDEARAETRGRVRSEAAKAAKEEAKNAARGNARGRN